MIHNNHEFKNNNMTCARVFSKMRASARIVEGDERVGDAARPWARSPRLKERRTLKRPKSVYIRVQEIARRMDSKSPRVGMTNIPWQALSACQSSPMARFSFESGVS